jgi:hypothetical protein
MVSSESTSAFDSGVPLSAIPSSDIPRESSEDTSAGTAAILYFYTAAVPASKILANQIQSDARYKGVITVICADSPAVRRYLMYPTAKVTITSVPVFVVKIGDEFKVYSANDAHKVFRIAIEASSSSSTEIIDLPLPSTRSSSRRSSSRSIVLDQSISVAV